MPRRILAALFLLCVGVTPQGTPDVQLMADVIAFEKVHDPFVRKLFGCPPEGNLTPEVCHPHLGTLNYGDWAKARKAAIRLYKIEECPRQ